MVTGESSAARGQCTGSRCGPVRWGQDETGRGRIRSGIMLLVGGHSSGPCSREMGGLRGGFYVSGDQVTRIFPLRLDTDTHIW